MVLCKANYECTAARRKSVVVRWWRINGCERHRQAGDTGGATRIKYDYVWTNQAVYKHNATVAMTSYQSSTQRTSKHPRSSPRPSSCDLPLATETCQWSFMLALFPNKASQGGKMLACFQKYWARTQPPRVVKYGVIDWSNTRGWSSSRRSLGCGTLLNHSSSAAGTSEEHQAHALTMYRSSVDRQR